MQDSDSKEEEECSDNEEDIVMIAKKFRNFFKKRNFRKNYKSNKKEDKKKKIICYKCKNSRHMKYDCSKFKDKRKFKRKTMKVTWDDSNESPSKEEQSQEEKTNMCFMGHTNSEVSDSESTIHMSYDEFEEAFEELHEIF